MKYEKIRVGDVVQLRKELQTNGGKLLAQGLKMRVFLKRGGLHLETLDDKPCESCGIGQIHRIKKVSAFDVEEVSE